MTRRTPGRTMTPDNQSSNQENTYKDEISIRTTSSGGDRLHALCTLPRASHKSVSRRAPAGTDQSAVASGTPSHAASLALGGDARSTASTAPRS